MIKSFLYSCFFLLIFSQNGFSQETISFDSFAKYDYQDDENTKSYQTSRVLYNSEGGDYYLVFWSKNNDITSVRLFDKKKNVYYEIKAKDFIQNLQNKNLEVENVHDLNTKNDYSKFQKEIFKDPNLYVITTGRKNVPKEFQKFYIEFKPSDKKENQIGCQPDFHIRGTFDTYLDDLEGTVVKMYFIKGSKKVRICTLKEMGKVDFSINLKL